MSSSTQLAMDGARFLALVWLFCLAIVAGMLVTNAVLGIQRYIRVRRLRLRHLPAPDDPRLRNVVSLRDWKRNAKAHAQLRDVA